MTTHDAIIRWLDWTGCKYLSVVRRLGPCDEGCGCGPQRWWDLHHQPQSSLINDGESPANDNTRLPRHRVMTIAHGLSQPSINEICIQHQWGRSNFCCPRNYWVNIINTSHPGNSTRTRERKGKIIFAGRRIIEDRWVMTPWPLACEGVISYIYIFRANIFLQGSDYSGLRPAQRSNNPYIFIIKLDRDKGQAS